MKPILYNYYRSSASYRVRIGLELKGIEYENRSVHLLRDGGEQFSAEFVRINPQKLVPTLEDQGQAISQSMAILEYLEETRPHPALLPRDPVQRAYVRQLALLIACDIHPLNNLRVLKHLKHELGRTDPDNHRWIQHWTAEGFTAFQVLLQRCPFRGRFCCGDTPGLAECFLIPQLYNARRFEVDLVPYSELCAIEAQCATLEAFQRAHPSRQPDA